MLGRGLVVSLLTTDLAVALLVLTFGWRYGYTETARSLWGWRQQHQLPLLAANMSVVAAMWSARWFVRRRRHTPTDHTQAA